MLDRIFFYKQQLEHVFEFEKNDYSLTVSLKKYPQSYIEFYQLAPGIILAFNHIRNRSFPSNLLSKEDYFPNLLIFDICLEGMCERFSVSDSFLSISKNRIVISSYHPLQELVFQKEYYDGISLYINSDLLDIETEKFLQMANIDFKQFTEKFHFEIYPYYNYATPCIIAFTNYLWKKHRTAPIGQIRLLTASLVHEFLALPEKVAKNLLLNHSQINPIKYCEKLLCQDLSCRITLKELAARTNISESTIKNRFKIVYGVTITDYMRNKRMELARTLLLETALSISEIAAKCGYENHSRFSAVFKKFYSHSPNDFRQMHITD